MNTETRGPIKKSGPYISEAVHVNGLGGPKRIDGFRLCIERLIELEETADMTLADVSQLGPLMIKGEFPETEDKPIPGVSEVAADILGRINRILDLVQRTRLSINQIDFST